MNTAITVTLVPTHDLTPENLPDLVRALHAARAAASSAAVAVDDGGTCNLDSPTLTVSSKSKRLAAAALKIAGISGWDRKGGKGLVEFVVGANCGGQANKRNAYCEAFARALTASGFDGGMYYQVD